MSMALKGVKGKVVYSGTWAEEEYFHGWRKECKEYVGRARTGKHATMKSKKYDEILYINFPKRAEIEVDE